MLHERVCMSQVKAEHREPPPLATLAWNLASAAGSWRSGYRVGERKMLMDCPYQEDAVT